MARHATLKMDYIGSCLSVNHRLGRRKDGGYYVKPETKAWQEEFQWLLKHLHLEDWRLPLEVTCSAWFKDERSACDLVNFQKCVLDPIEDLIHVNDKDFRWHDGTRNIGVTEPPYLIIAIRESGAMPSITLTKPTRRALKVKTSAIPFKNRTRGFRIDKKAD